jgi:transposase
VHLDSAEIVLDIPEEDKACPETGKPLKRICFEISEKLEYRPGKLIVNMDKEPKYTYSDGTSELGVVKVPEMILNLRGWTLPRPHRRAGSFTA